MTRKQRIRTVEAILRATFHADCTELATKIVDALDNGAS